MIIDTDSLPDRGREACVMVDGTFDPLHDGHIAYFDAARRFAGTRSVVCNISGDCYLAKAKGRTPVVPDGIRAKVIDALESIDLVHVSGELSTATVLRMLKPEAYIKGKDWEGKLPKEQVELCEELGIEIVYLDTVTNSSTDLVAAFTKAVRLRDYEAQVDRFEAWVAEHPPFGQEHYGDRYFMGNWRDNDNSYNEADRRRIEGKNPENIMRVFNAPKTILDWGCGPGMLMLFLQELGADVYGVDFSQAAKDNAPPSVLERIQIGNIDEYKPFDGVDSWDLAVFREVNEHLTVPQMMGAVHVLTRQYRPQFIYVTTRYHPDPDSLLDVALDDPGVDPSHINLVNKQFLRALFVAGGYRTRKDLESELDWKNFGRVIALERND